MDNLSKSSEEIMAQNPKEVNDIQFEEVFNIDKIQETLHQSLHEESPQAEFGFENVEPPKDEEKIEFDEAPKVEDIPNVESNVEFTPQVPDFGPATPEVDLDSKKYVIYVDSDNITYMENLSIKERRNVVNKVLREQNLLSIREKELARRKNFLKHIAFACITFVIAFPIMFFIVNVSMQATMKNLQQAKDNFSKLYKQQGKIQQLTPSAD